MVDLLNPVRWYQQVPAGRQLRSFHNRKGHCVAAQRERAAALLASHGRIAVDAAAAMTEASLQHEIRQAALQRDLLFYHTYRSDNSDEGYPDVHIVGPRGQLLWELKTERKPVTLDQFHWLNGLWLSECDADEVRPTAWESGWVEAKLDAIASPKHEPPAWYRPRQQRPGGRAGSVRG